MASTMMLPDTGPLTELGSSMGGTSGAGARTLGDLRAARETRAGEALKMKDEQLRILQEQNSQLLHGLDKVEVGRV